MENLKHKSEYEDILRINLLTRSVAGNDVPLLCITDNVKTYMPYSELLRFH